MPDETLYYRVQEVHCDGAPILPEHYDSRNAAWLAADSLAARKRSEGSGYVHHYSVVRCWGRRSDRLDHIAV
jgi:hypothetical protein